MRGCDLIPLTATIGADRTKEPCILVKKRWISMAVAFAVDAPATLGGEPVSITVPATSPSLTYG
jgi:hypothetical protein